MVSKPCRQLELSKPWLKKMKEKKKEIKAKLITFAWRGLFLFVSSLGKKKMEEKTAYFRGEEGRNSKKLCLPLSG